MRKTQEILRGAGLSPLDIDQAQIVIQEFNENLEICLQIAKDYSLDQKRTKP
jgi:hypothetical protein